MSHRRLTDQEIQARIEAGASVREERRKKAQRRVSEFQQARQEALTSVGLDAHKRRLRRLNAHLSGVVSRREPLKEEVIPEIIEFLDFPLALHMTNHCREELTSLIGYCAQFEKSPVASELYEKAYACWDKILSYDGILPTGSLLINIFASGSISRHTYELLRKHSEKFITCGLDVPLTHMCHLHLKNGGMTDVLTGEVKIWDKTQKEVLSKLLDLYEGQKA
jgi:hypothetical protein